MAYIRAYQDKWRAEIQRNGVRSSKVFARKRDAQAWAMEQESQAIAARKGGGKTFGDAVDRYIADVSSKKDGRVWEVRRLNAMREYFTHDAGLSDIQAPEIVAWRDARLKTVSGSTVVREANLLRNLFKVAMNEWHWMEHEPFKGVKLPAENDARHQVWPWQLIRRVLRAERTGKTAELQAAFHIALRTGMRLQEVLAAPENFDTRRQVVTVKTKTEKRGQIPIGRIATRLLMRPRFVVGANEASVLFSKLCKELSIVGLTFHDTRATALTHLARKVDVLTLAKISRHKDMNLLLRVYYRESSSDIAKRI
jgi:integrase